jgi:hypothetical protein
VCSLPLAGERQADRPERGKSNGNRCLILVAYSYDEQAYVDYDAFSLSLAASGLPLSRVRERGITHGQSRNIAKEAGN